MKKLLLVLLALALAGGAAWWFYGRKASDKPRVLATATVETGAVRKVLEATGIVKARVGAQVKIGSRASGTVERMLVKVGDRVNKGDLIAVIDDREVQAQKDETQARLEHARAELSRVETVYPLQIKEAEANLAAAKADRDYAEKNRARRQELVRQDLEARDILDQAEQSALVAENDVYAREATLARLKAEYEQELIKARRSVQEAQAALDTLSVRLSYFDIYSPLTGVVSLVTAQEGETLVSGLQVSSIITVLDPTRLEMWIYVDETDVGQVKPGMNVEFSVDAYHDKTFYGRIDQIYPQPEIRDNIVYYQAIVSLEPAQAEFLRPEMTTQCQIVVEEKKDVLVIPNNALKWVGADQVVFVQEPDGRVTRVTPELGLSGLATSEVLSGLAAGQRVATQIILPGEKPAPAPAQPNRS